MASQVSARDPDAEIPWLPSSSQEVHGPAMPLALPGEHAVDVGLVLLKFPDERRVLRVGELVVLHLTREHRACSVRS